MSNITQFTTGGVKSIQYGTYAPAAGGLGNSVITISSINPVKAMVVLNGSYVYGSYWSVFATLVSLTATTLTVNGPFYYTSSWLGYTGSWQVIEYY